MGSSPAQIQVPHNVPRRGDTNPRGACQSKFISVGVSVVASHKVEQLNNRGERRCHIGKRSRRQHLLGTVDLLGAHARLLNVCHSAAAGIDLDRQRNQLEQHAKRKEDQRERREPRDVHEQAHKQHDRPGVLGKVDDRHEGGTHLHHGVAALTLGGMTRLVAGNGNACDRPTRTVGVRQIQVVVLRVVMVGELAGNPLDTHGVATVGVEHAASDGSARIAVRAHLGPRFVRRVDIALRGKAKHRADKNN